MPNKPDLAALLKFASPLPWKFKDDALTAESDLLDATGAKVEATNDNALICIFAVNAVPELLLLREFWEAERAFSKAQGQVGIGHELYKSDRVFNAYDAALDRYSRAVAALKEFYAKEEKK